MVSALVIAALVQSAIATVRGVLPENEKLYEAAVINGEKKWHCLNDSSVVLSYDQINDNYCDCPDGSDEPGTNACEYRPEMNYYCVNAGYFPGYIENYKLDDGVCDYDLCCDGSDEKSGLCPNVCSKVALQYRDYQDKMQNDIKRSLDTKEKSIKRAKSIVFQIEQKLMHLKLDLNWKTLELNGNQLSSSSLVSLLKNYYRSFFPFSPESPHLEDSAMESLKSEITLLLKQIQFYTNNLAQDYGPKSIFRVLEKKQISGNYKGYNYRIGLFDSIFQDDVLIGKFDTYLDRKMIYANGQKCWNGPKRSASIEFICGSMQKILSVSEPEKCHYQFEISTPLVCEEYTEDDLRANFKINYDLL